MKNIRLLVAAAVFAAASLTSSAVILRFGPANFKLTSIEQNTNQFILSTNTTSSSTNITATTISKTHTTIIKNPQLLDMLSNSLNMAWPAGSTLKLDDIGDFDVVNGTNLVEDVSEVLRLVPGTNSVTSGTDVDKVTINTSGESETDTQKFTQTSLATLVYDDSARTTVNGTTTQFTVSGIEVTHGINSTSGIFKDVSTFVGSGAGNISSTVSTNQIIVGGGFNATEF